MGKGKGGTLKSTGSSSSISSVWKKSDSCDKLCFVCARKRTLKIKACLVQEIQQNETNRVAAA